MPREYGFDEQLRMSQGICTDKDIPSILLGAIPGALRVEKANSKDDRQGTDYWVRHARGEPYSIDVKARKEDWAFKPEHSRADDLALETWSVVEKEVVGWTRNPSKRTDYILWYWENSGRWCLVPFAMLCAVFRDFWEQWRTQFKCDRQHTPDRNYHSECVFVPRHLVWASIYKKFSGSVVAGSQLTSTQGQSSVEYSPGGMTEQERLGW